VLPTCSSSTQQLNCQDGTALTVGI